MRTYWRGTTPNPESLPSETIGTQLRYYRIKGNLSQRHVADELGYLNVNFMSMIEKNRSGIPADRFIDFMEAYEVPQNMRLDLFARCYSVHWEALKHLLV